MIEFQNVSKVYPGNQVAAKNINLKIEDGEFVVFIGTSGSGKTTLMRMINRMNEPTSGKILIDGKDIADMDPVKLRRRIGYVIQRIGLMPHMTIYENIVTVPKLLKWDDDKLEGMAEELIQKVDLPVSSLSKYPSEMSGGQQQRIGVIRALAANQEIILMDEPFGALDPITRDSLQNLVKKLQKEMGKTFVFVTHDMNEALTLADKIVIMDKGEIVQQGTPEYILKNPATEYVKELLGEEKLNEAKTSYNTVDSIMIRNPISINEKSTIKEALPLMKEKRVDSLFITDDENHLTGVVDVFLIGKFGRRHTTLEEIKSEAYAIPENTTILECLRQFHIFGLRNLPVIDEENHLTGLVTRAVIVDTLYNNMFVNEDEPDLSVVERDDVKIIVEDGDDI